MEYNCSRFDLDNASHPHVSQAAHVHHTTAVDAAPLSPWTSPESQRATRSSRVALRGLYKAPVLRGSALLLQAKPQGGGYDPLPVTPPSEGCTLLCQVF